MLGVNFAEMIRSVSNQYAPKGALLAAKAREAGVPRTADFERILQIPVRQQRLVDRVALSKLLRLPHSNAELFQDQAQALQEIGTSHGTFIAMEVGSGKGLISILAPLIRGSQRPLILVPANMRDDTKKEVIPRWREHFPIPKNLVVESYEILSSPTSGERFLSTLQPDHIILDEADKLKDLGTARGIRFLQYFQKNPHVTLDAMSGSFFDRRISDFAAVLKLALRMNYPLPFDESDLEKWGLAVDADVEDENRVGIGALLEFYGLLTEEEQRSYHDPGREQSEKAMMLLTARMKATPGVLFSAAKTTNIEVRFHEIKPKVPDVVLKHFDHLKRTWDTPRGDQIKDAVHMYRVVNQLAQGFFYRWVWPKIDGVETPNLVWLDARRRWHAFIRNTLLKHESHNMHSASLVEDACERFERFNEAKTFKDHAIMAKLKDTRMIDSQEYRNWMLVRNQYEPVTEVVWESDYLVNEVANWLDQNVGIAWVGSRAFGDALQKKGFRYYKGGQSEIRYETVSCVASWQAHGRGKNLQQFHKGLVINGPTRGRDWQQLIGRFDRTGQLSPFVDFTVCLNAREIWNGFLQAGRDARYSVAAGQEHKLVKATSYVQTNQAWVDEQITARQPLWRYPDKNPREKELNA